MEEQKFLLCQLTLIGENIRKKMTKVQGWGVRVSDRSEGGEQLQGSLRRLLRGGDVSSG